MKQFRHWFDLMGLQRHLKASGIFCRLLKRDGKSGYLKDVPRVFQHMLVCGYLKKPVISVYEKWKFNAISHGLWQIAEESYRGFVATFSTNGASG